MMQTLSPLFAERHAQILLADQSPGELTINGNADALLGAFNNLANNTLDHGGDGVTLNVSLQLDDDHIELIFSDDGPGIDRDLAEEIFDPFFTTRGDGTGLGLAIVQSVVLGHRGTISLFQSEEGGAGFRICFPATQPHASLKHSDADMRGAA